VLQQQDVSRPPLEAESPPATGLGELAQLASEAGAFGIAAEAKAAFERIAERRFYVACVGQFKRGKSSLLNALVGRAILPVGVLPVTSVPTVLRYGERPAARVRFSGGSWRDIRLEDLAAYVAEENNSENKMGVQAVEVFVPSPLLSSGMCLVDTPGIGSVLAANTAATREFVPHVDAALVVLGADPPISGEELALVEEVSRHVENLLFVLNKADRLPAEESDEAARFAERVLVERLGARAAPLLTVSATERLASCPTRDWEKLESKLDSLARESGADLGYLLMAEVDRLTKRFTGDREAFLSSAREPAERELVAAIDASVAEESPQSLRARARDAATAVARRRLDAWLATEQPAAEALYRGAAERLLALGNEFLQRFVEYAELGPETFPAELGHEAGFRAKSRLYYTDLLAVAQPSPFSWVLDRFRTTASLRRAASRDAAAYLERLLSSNSARIQNDLIERVCESRRRLEAEIRSRLSEAVRSAAGALERAKARLIEGEASVAAELGCLDGLRRSARLIGSHP
jgi:GTP-binding protein EngB required for normal cell division